jgi:hypothetical protein
VPRHFGNNRCRCNKSIGIETFRFVARRHDKATIIDGFCPVVWSTLITLGQIRRNRFDLDQNGPEKLNWIELPGTA